MTTYPGDDPQTPDDPQHPTGQPPENGAPTAADQEETEPTQPVGYWQRRAHEEAAERARAQGGQPYPTTAYPQGGQPYPTTAYPQGGPVFNPTSSQASPPSQPAPPPQPAPGYGPGYQGGQNPYGQGPFGQVPDGQPTPPSYGGQPPVPGQLVPYAPMPAYGGFVAPPPDHPQSTLSLVLGLVGVIGAFIFCGVTLVVSPFAWALGRGALKEIQASQGRLGGESQARTGMILGIIGTVFAIIAVIALIGFIVLLVLADTSTTGGSSV